MRAFKYSYLIIYFFVFFTLGMCAGLPLLIHYAGSSSFHRVPERSAGEAFFWLGAGCALWLLLLFLFFRFFILSSVMKKRKLEKLLQYGQRVNGTVVLKEKLSQNPNNEFLSLHIEFKNFAGAVVRVITEITDTEPEKNRFEKGKTVPLIIDDSGKQPLVMVEGKGIQWNRSLTALAVFVLLLFLALPPALLVYAYLNESNGYGWRFLSFSHPFILVPFILLLDMTVLILLLRGPLAKKNASHLKLNGKAAVATITNIVQTGVYINEQPQVRITVEFDDSRGFKHAATVKKIIRLLDIPHYVVGSELRILYDPGNPEKIEFAE